MVMQPKTLAAKIKLRLRPFVRLAGLDFTSLLEEEFLVKSGHFLPREYYTVTSVEIEFLNRLVIESGNFSGPIIEIGTLFGITATHIALAKKPEQKIITVDNYCWNPWQLTPERHYLMTQYVLRYLIQTGHVEQIKQDKNEFYESYSGPPPSLVFLDADHSYAETKKDILWAKRAGAKIIAGHDYYDGVKLAVDEFGGPFEKVKSLWALHPVCVAQA